MEDFLGRKSLNGDVVCISKYVNEWSFKLW